LIGGFPRSLFSLPHLYLLHLDSNRFNCEIPFLIRGLTSLRVLTLFRNSLIGSLPSDISSLTRLERLDLSFNMLSGEIPNLSPLMSLRQLKLQSNTFVGPFPGFVFSLSMLEELNISDNQLEGSIPSSHDFPPSLSTLHLSNNHLTGTIPDRLGICHRLSELDLSNNELNGNIPEAIGSLHELKVLNLSANHLNGTIPSSILNMKFTFEPTFKFENNMDLIDPRSMLLNYERRDLNNLTSYSFALFAIIFHYFDLITDILASITLSKADDLIFALSILFLLLPSLALMLAPQSQYDRLANIFQLRILLEAYRSIIVFIKLFFILLILI